MSYLNVSIARNESSNVAEKIVSAELWFVDNERASKQNAVTFYLDIKVTDGPNTKNVKAKYVNEVVSDFKAINRYYNTSKLCRNTRVSSGLLGIPG